MIQRIIALVIILIIVIGGGVYAFRLLAPEPDDLAQGPQYATAEVRRGDIVVGVTATGGLNPTQGGSIWVPWPRGPIVGPFPTNFTVTEVYVQEGDSVRMGQPLVELSSPDMENRLLEIEAQLRQERENLANRLGVEPHELSRINPAAGITLHSPIAGRVTNLEATEGKSIEQGEAVARVVDDSEWTLTANLTPGEFGTIRMGQRVAVRFAEFAGLLEARVTSINPNSVPMTSTELLDCREREEPGAPERTQFVYRVTIQGKNPGLIVPGMVAEIGRLPEGMPEDASVNDWSDRVTWYRYCSPVDGYGSEERILSTAKGIVTQVHVQEMEIVEAGAPIISFSGEETTRSIEMALEKIRDLEMQAQSMREFIGDLTVKAPMDGIVAELRAQVGQSIEIGEHLGSIYNPLEMEMWVQVDDVDVLRVQQDSPVEVRVSALGDEVLSGRVMHISTSGIGEGGITYFQVRIRVEGNERLRPGMQAEAYIRSGEARDVLLIPLEAIFQEDGQYKTEVLDESGIPRVVPIEVGLMSDFEAEIRSGLEEGQLVVTGSSADILPGQAQPSLFPGAGSGGSPGQSGGSAGGGGSDGGGAVDMPLPVPDLPERDAIVPEAAN